MKIEGKRTTKGAERRVVFFSKGVGVSAENHSESGRHWDEIVTGSGFILVRDVSNTGKHYCYLACISNNEEQHRVKKDDYCVCILENGLRHGMQGGGYDIDAFFPYQLRMDIEHIRAIRETILKRFPMVKLENKQASLPLYFSSILDELEREEDVMFFKNGKEMATFGAHENFFKVINSLIKEGIFEVGVRKDEWVLNRIK